MPSIPPPRPTVPTAPAPCHQRRTRPIAVGAVLVLAVLTAAGTVGVADAATGGSFLLGRANRETATATLRAGSGTPLALRAPEGSAPLSVNSSVEVKHLDAAEVGGLPAAALQQTVTGHCAAGIGAIGSTGSVSCAAPVSVVVASGSWIVPPGAHLLDVRVTGGGGGGSSATSASGSSRLAGGGGAGARTEALLAVTPGERLDVVVGAGGRAATSSARAASGGTTVVYRQSRDGAMLVAARGGRPGLPGGRGGCRAGAGGRPAAGGAVPTTVVAGELGAAGSCPAGGGAPGYPGGGGAGASGGAAARAGEAGIAVMTVAG